MESQHVWYVNQLFQWSCSITRCHQIWRANGKLLLHSHGHVPWQTLRWPKGKSSSPHLPIDCCSIEMYIYNYRIYIYYNILCVYIYMRIQSIFIYNVYIIYIICDILLNIMNPHETSYWSAHKTPGPWRLRQRWPRWTAAPATRHSGIRIYPWERWYGDMIWSIWRYG